MKFTRFFLVFGILLCLSSCSKDNHEPYRPTEWQYEKYSDSGILPGDDFYRFVCGKGIAAEGSDSWAPYPRLNKQAMDYMILAFSDGDSNPVPVLKKLNELKSKFASSPANRAAAFAGIQARLNKIGRLERIEDLPVKAAEYYRSGYNFLFIQQAPLDGHKLGLMVVASPGGLLSDWTEEELAEAGIRKEDYDRRLKEARRFEQYLSGNIKAGGDSAYGLDAGNPEECKQLKEYAESFASTKAGGSAFERFASALGNKNPDFLPSDDASRQFFELWDKAGQELPNALNAADAFLWCAAVTDDLTLLLETDSQANFFQTIKYPNLLMNISHTFCDMYVRPEAISRNEEIFKALRSAIAERIDQSEWMTPYSKARAREKADAMECHLGIFDWSRYEADLPVSEDICSALHEIGASHVSKTMRNSDDNQNLDHIIASYYLTPISGSPAYAANSFYLRNVNALCILPSTFLLNDMNPEFPLQTYIIAHEICHGFDADGSHYNARGEFGDWWSIDDKLAFRKKQEQLISIFNQYYAGGGIFCNGTETIDEDLADLGGLEIAWYNASRALEGKYGGEQLTEMKRRFFKSYAVYWAQYASLENKLKQIKEDVHSINEYRVNGIVNHIDDWYQLFDVTPERKFYLAPEHRVHLW